MRRVTVALFGVLLGLCGQSGVPAVADPVACQQSNSHGICVVEAEFAQQPATRPVAAGSGSGDRSGEAACALDATGAAIPCQEGVSWWVQSLQCYAQPMLEQPPTD